LDVIRRNIASLDRKYEELTKICFGLGVPGASGGGSSRGGTPMVMSPLNRSRAPSPGRSVVPTVLLSSPGAVGGSPCNTPMVPMAAFPAISLSRSASPEPCRAMPMPVLPPLSGDRLCSYPVQIGAPRCHSPGRDRNPPPARQASDMTVGQFARWEASVDKAMPVGHQIARSLSPPRCRETSPAPSASTLGGGASIVYPSTNTCLRAPSPEPGAPGGSCTFPIAGSPPVPGMSRQPSPGPQVGPPARQPSPGPQVGPPARQPSYMPIRGNCTPSHFEGRSSRRSQGGSEFSGSVNSMRFSTEHIRAPNQYSEHASLIRASPFASSKPSPGNSVNVPVPVDNTSKGHAPPVAMLRAGPAYAASPLMTKSMWC